MGPEIPVVWTLTLSSAHACFFSICLDFPPSLFILSPFIFSPDDTPNLALAPKGACTSSPCIGSTESEPPDPQGSPPLFLFSERSLTTVGALGPARSFPHPTAFPQREAGLGAEEGAPDAAQDPQILNLDPEPSFPCLCPFPGPTSPRAWGASHPRP